MPVHSPTFLIANFYDCPATSSYVVHAGICTTHSELSCAKSHRSIVHFDLYRLHQGTPSHGGLSLCAHARLAHSSECSPHSLSASSPPQNRTVSLEELQDVGWFDALGSAGTVICEWPEVLPLEAWAPFDTSAPAGSSAARAQTDFGCATRWPLIVTIVPEPAGTDAPTTSSVSDAEATDTVEGLDDGRARRVTIEWAERVTSAGSAAWPESLILARPMR